MKTESWIRKGTKVVMMLGVLVAGRAVVNYQGTWRAINALVFGNRVDCSAGIIANDIDYPFDAIAVFGAGLDRDGGPSLAGKERLAGAAEAYKNGQARRIALVGDADGEGNGRTLGKRYLVGHQFVPEEAIFVGRDGSINTVTDAARLVEMASSFGWRRVLLSDSDSHRDRTTQIVCSSGLAASSFSAHDDSPDLKESIELLLTSVDPEGWIPTVVKRITLRGRWP